ncbi:MAG: hypothetical protein KF891_10000 [Rhizobacter sp.]|nr:hypothetical protein [Rhizobacter sp.]
MKALFGVVSLLLVLVIVGVMASRQMNALNTLPAAAPASGVAPAATVRAQSQQLQQKVLDDVNRALEQGAARNDEADK